MGAGRQVARDGAANLKILLLADTDRHGSLGYYHHHALTHAGHDVVGYDYTRFYSRFRAVNFLGRRSRAVVGRVVSRIEREVLGLVRAHRFDMVLTIKGELISRQLLANIRRLGGMPRVNWFADPVLQLYHPPHVLLEAIPEYDYVFVKDEYFLQEVRLISGGNTHFLPGGYDHVAYRPMPASDDLRCGVAFVGTAHPKRVAILSGIADRGLRIYGAGWSGLPTGHPLAACAVGRSVFGEEHARLFCSARINVNLHAVGEAFGINHRAFEIAGAGAFQMVDARMGLERYFEPDKEIVAFRTPDELRDKVDYFLARPDERAAIAARGYEKARAHFTIEQRFKELLDIVGAA